MDLKIYSTPILEKASTRKENICVDSSQLEVSFEAEIKMLQSLRLQPQAATIADLMKKINCEQHHSKA